MLLVQYLPALDDVVSEGLLVELNVVYTSLSKLRDAGRFAPLDTSFLQYLPALTKAFDDVAAGGRFTRVLLL
jgi:hypothetical protein